MAEAAVRLTDETVPPETVQKLVENSPAIFSDPPAENSIDSNPPVRVSDVILIVQVASERVTSASSALPMRTGAEAPAVCSAGIRTAPRSFS